MAETQDKADIMAADRMRESNAALSDWDRIRAEGERISREEGYKVMTAEIASLHAQIHLLRSDNNRRADLEQGLRDGVVRLQDEIATLRAENESLRITDAEREVIAWCLGWCEGLHAKNHATLRTLLERMT